MKNRLNPVDEAALPAKDIVELFPEGAPKFLDTKFAGLDTTVALAPYKLQQTPEQKKRTDWRMLGFDPNTGHLSKSLVLYDLDSIGRGQANYSGGTGQYNEFQWEDGRITQNVHVPLSNWQAKMTYIPEYGKPDIESAIKVASYVEAGKGQIGMILPYVWKRPSKVVHLWEIDDLLNDELRMIPKTESNLHIPKAPGPMHYVAMQSEQTEDIGARPRIQPAGGEIHYVHSPLYIEEQNGLLIARTNFNTNYVDRGIPGRDFKSTSQLFGMLEEEGYAFGTYRGTVPRYSSSTEQVEELKFPIPPTFQIR